MLYESNIEGKTKKRSMNLEALFLRALNGKPLEVNLLRCSISKLNLIV